MITRFFYLALTPTEKKLSYLYSHVFKITYQNDKDLVWKQLVFEEDFRRYNRFPEHYNAVWSAGTDMEDAAVADRRDEIRAWEMDEEKKVFPVKWP
ncbi:hypothetical protein [Chitinophaga flava]|nr:hypothetical protein [Chitinophaga flava]